MKSPEATLPSAGVVYCNKLFELEKKYESLTPEERKQQRLEHEKPVLEAFWTWVDEHSSKCLPKSKLSDAFKYAINQKEGLMNYLQDGNCSICNNLAENVFDHLL